jgi:hypothetical protein
VKRSHIRILPFRLVGSSVECHVIGLFTILLGRASFWFFCRVGAPPPRLKTETDPVSETLCFLFVEIRTMD